MAIPRKLYSVFFLIGILAAFTVLSQEAPAPAADPLDKAIENFQAPQGISSKEIAEARDYIVAHRQEALPRIMPLLDSERLSVRLNATIILSRMIDAGDSSPELVAAMEKAFQDSTIVIAHWGFKSLLSLNITPAQQRNVIEKAVSMERPRPFRRAALVEVGEKQPKVAVPVIVAHMQALLKEYKSQVETRITTVLPPTTPAKTGAATPPKGALPGPAMSKPLTTPGPFGGGGGPRMPGPGGFSGSSGPSERRGVPGADKSEESGAGPRVGPGAGGPGDGGEAGPADRTARGPTGSGPQQQPNPAKLSFLGQQATPPPVLRKNLPYFSPESLQTLTEQIEDLPAVAEMHQSGIVLEQIIKASSPAEKLFGFETTPPWDLDQCVEKAVEWLKAHATEFAPENVVKTPPAAGAESTAPAAETPAPGATTEAAPAGEAPSAEGAEK